MQKLFSPSDIFAQDTPKQRQQLIDELEHLPPDPSVCMELTRSQVLQLASLLAQLPYRYFQLLALRYSFHYKDKKITATTGVILVQGTIAYCQDRLTQLMNLGRPIADKCWKAALEECIQSERYPLPPGSA